MRPKILLCAVIALLTVTGCRTVSETLMSEVVQIYPEPDWSHDRGWQNSTWKDFEAHFGADRKAYRKYIYEGLKLLRVTLLSKGDNYIFEMQTAGDIKLANRYYGKDMRFDIAILDTPMNIFTTVALKDAVLVSGPRGGILIRVDGRGELVSAEEESEYKVVARLRLEIDRDHMRIHLPKKLLPDRTNDWWSDDQPSFSYMVSSGLALSPLEPLPTNLPDVFYVPAVYHLWYPHDLTLYITTPFTLERVSNTSQER